MNLDNNNPAPQEDSLFGQPGAPAANPPGLNLAVAVKNLEQGYRSLRNQIMVVLLMLAMLNGSVNIFLLKQVSMIRKQAIELSVMMEDYQKRGAPKMDAFVDRLKQFGQTNPEFNQVLGKYFTNASNVVMPPAAPPAKK